MLDIPQGTIRSGRLRLEIGIRSHEASGLPRHPDGDFAKPGIRDISPACLAAVLTSFWFCFFKSKARNAPNRHVKRCRLSEGRQRPGCHQRHPRTWQRIHQFPLPQLQYEDDGWADGLRSHIPTPPDVQTSHASTAHIEPKEKCSDGETVRIKLVWAQERTAVYRCRWMARRKDRT
jgi:hypothetical protein